MKCTKAALALALLVSASCAMGEGFVSLSAATPQLAIVKEWHRALLENDFPAYERESRTKHWLWFRGEYDEMRRWTPEIVKVTAPKALPNGNFELQAIGCKNERRQAASFILVSVGTHWTVLATGWAQVWGPDVRACPV